MQELLGKKIITDEEAADLSWIEHNKELYKFLRENKELFLFVQAETSKNIRAFIEKVKKLTEDKDDKISYYEYLLEFVDNMIRSVEKRSMSNIKQSVQTNTAMDSLYALRKEHVDNKLASLLEEFKRLEENVEKLRQENDSKQKEVDMISLQLEELRRLRNTIQDEKNSLERQVKGRLEQISRDFAEEKALKKQEMSRELQEELKALTRKRDELYQEINSIIEEHESKSTISPLSLGSYEVEWVPINEGHEIYYLSHWSLDTYFNQLIEIYCLRTNKSREEALSDFAKNTPALIELNKMFKVQFTNEKINDTLYIKKILECKTWDDESQYLVKKIYSLLAKIRVPKYIEKKNFIRNVDALNVYLQSLSLKLELSKALAERDTLKDELENLLISEPEKVNQKTFRK